MFVAAAGGGSETGNLREMTMLGGAVLPRGWLQLGVGAVVGVRDEAWSHDRVFSWPLDRRQVERLQKVLDSSSAKHGGKELRKRLGMERAAEGGEAGSASLLLDGTEDLRILWADVESHQRKHKPWKDVDAECDEDVDPRRRDVAAWWQSLAFL